MMQLLEILGGTGLLFASLLAAHLHQTKIRGAAWRLFGIGAIATVGALLVMAPVRQHIHDQQAAATAVPAQPGGARR